MVTIRATFKHNTTDGIAHTDRKAATVEAAIEAATKFMKQHNYTFVSYEVLG